MAALLNALAANNGEMIADALQIAFYGLILIMVFAFIPRGRI